MASFSAGNQAKSALYLRVTGTTVTQSIEFPLQLSPRIFLLHLVVTDPRG